jgi:alkylation response protein AidB-like acyl-CoA dehydrogenase
MNAFHPAWRAAAALDRALTGARAFAPRRLLALDEEERFPINAWRFLADWGVADYLIPIAQGGQWESVEQLLALVRVVARRDLTVAFSLGPSLLAALPVWIAGDDGQRARVAELLRAGRTLALATTERAHGSDLLANRTRAIRDGEGWRLTGEKWLIGNATRADALLVFARTSSLGGPHGFSLFLVEKRRVDPRTWAHLPRVRTLGMRGADLSGVRFRGCQVPGDALVGRAGGAFETLHRTLTVTRTLCAGLSLGAADAALRLVADFARSRRLYGGTVLDLPHARDLLTGAFVDCLIGEAVAAAAARAVQAGESPVFASAVAKYFVPTRVERLLRDLAVVLGARFYLREGHPWAAFQRVMRDAAVVSVFEGNTVVNLGLVASQVGRAADGAAPDEAAMRERLDAVFRLDRPQPAVDPAHLNLERGRTDLAVEGLTLVSRALDAPTRMPHWETLAAICQLVGELRTQAAACRSALAAEWAARAGGTGRLSPRLLALAGRYCDLHAAAVCVQLWTHNSGRMGIFFGRGDWLALALDRLLGSCAAPRACAERTASELVDRAERGGSFSALADSCDAAAPRSDFLAPRDGFAASGADTTAEANGRRTH